MKDTEAGGRDLSQDHNVGQTMASRDGTAKTEHALHWEKRLPLKLQDCTRIQRGRDLHHIVEGWKRFANIEWLSATCREDVNFVRRDGVKALSYLLPVAQRDTHQSAVIARFLLSLYNGPRFPMDMTRLRGLDHELLIDCITVLMMDSTQGPEIHNYVENGQEFWEQMACDWGLNVPQVKP